MRELGFLAAREAGAHEDRHSGAELGEQLRLFHHDVPAADDDHRLGEIVECHRGRRRQVAAAGQSGHVVGYVRFGAGGDEVVRGVDPATIDVQREAVDEARMAAKDVDAVVGCDVTVLALA